MMKDFRSLQRSIGAFGCVQRRLLQSILLIRYHSLLDYLSG
jgi:hypothetical protein